MSLLATIGKRLIHSAAAGVLAALLVAPALAAGLNTAKNAGTVGEMANGYVGVVAGKSVDAATQRAIDEINLQRQQQYRAIAKKNNVPVNAVAALAGKKLIEREPGGRSVRDSTGAWKTK